MSDSDFAAELATAQALAWANLKSRLKPEAAALLNELHRELYGEAFCAGAIWLSNRQAAKAQS